MKRSVIVLSAAALAVALSPAARVVSGQSATGGTVKGHIRLAGKAPGNVVIRMGVDPMCAKINAGKRVIQDSVVAASDGSLANVFVSLQGTFPPTAVPSAPVVIDQRGCVYSPRVVGVRVGQILEVRNSDDLLHNVHGLSRLSNGFNVGQPKAGMIQQFRPKDEEIMLAIKCDIHRWMTSFVGVVNHPYFAVTDSAGNFEIRNVPAGARSLQIWHEQYGVQTRPVQVRSGASAVADFEYAGTEKPAR
jgi:plastocyanin